MLQQDEIIKWLKQNLDSERFNHSLGTAKTSVELANMFKVDVSKAEVAGLVHDCAKCKPIDELMLILSNMQDISDFEIKNKKTLHAPAGVFIAKNKFGITDKDILSSIRWHTIGKLNMTDFEKVIFISDKIEPNTRPDEYINLIKPYLYEENGLDKAMLQCFKLTIKSLVERGLVICQPSIDIYNKLIGIYGQN